jgi:hypothetical protein
MVTSPHARGFIWYGIIDTPTVGEAEFQSGSVISGRQLMRTVTIDDPKPQGAGKARRRALRSQSGV